MMKFTFMEMRDHVIGFGKKMLSQSESHLVKNWPIYEMYGNVFLNQMKTITMKFMVFPEILYLTPIPKGKENA
jgi:hypothetical protein